MNPAWTLGLTAVIGAALLGGCSHPHHIKNGDCCGNHMKSYPFDENGEPIMPESEKSAKAGRAGDRPQQTAQRDRETK